MAPHHRSKNSKSKLLISVHSHAKRPDMQTWALRRQGEVLVEDTTRRSVEVSQAKFAQVLGGLRSLVVENDKGFRWEIPCPFDPREVAARSPGYFDTRGDALMALVQTALAVEEVA